MNAGRFRQDAAYWDQKLANYLHDPPDKALSIPGHEERSRRLSDILNIVAPDKDVYQRADKIASGMDRAQVPGYHTEASQNGAIDFGRHPVITHPTGDRFGLSLDLFGTIDRAGITKSLQDILEHDLESLSRQEGYMGNHLGYAPARFHYVHHALRERLAQENVGDLGGLWHRLPADTRIPDHSIWQHCALVSALTSCFCLSAKHQASLMVFNLTPVQDFIGRARKLRDLWTGSLILSWLAFEGIRQVIYTYGSDHVIYPSLIGQPMVNQLFVGELKFEPGWLSSSGGEQKAGVASFPNKFVFLAPSGNEKEVAQDIQDGIMRAWLNLGDKILEIVENKVKRQDASLRNQFHRQLGHFWDFHWASCPLLDEKVQSSFETLLPETVWGKPLAFLDKSKGLPYETRGEGAFYGVTHALTQSFLAAGKSRRQDNREEEPGIKCSLHGDLEALHFTWEGDKNPRPDKDPFWKSLKESWETKSDFKRSERLSAIALIKRLAYRACQQMPDHPLKPFFQRGEGFPSTTEMALSDWLDHVEAAGLHKELPGLNWRKIVAQVVHEQESDSRELGQGPEVNDIRQEEREICRRILREANNRQHPLGDEDKYFSVLMMDGDHMGKLVNGETLASTWSTVIHPELVKRVQNENFDKRFRDFWQAELNQPRLLAPGVHAAISEALGDFSLYTVPEIIRRYRGFLIYAGGDDVCAVLPVSTAIPAAREIARRYCDDFVYFPASHTIHPSESIAQSWKPQQGRLGLHLGKGDDISISAGLLITHHKKPLEWAMRRAHELLEKAKQEGGRNALAVELAKRSGESRLFITGWQERAWEPLQLAAGSPRDDTLLTSFIQAGAWLGTPAGRSLSTSLIYRLAEFHVGLEAILKETPAALPTFLASQIMRSGTSIKLKDQDALGIGGKLAALLGRQRPGKKESEIDAKALIIARFIGSCMAKAPQGQGDTP